MAKIISEKLIKNYVSNNQIYDHYFGDDWELHMKYNSPLRKDPIPSFAFKDVGEVGEPFIIWTDFGRKSDRKDAIGFVMALYRIPKEQALNKIWKEMILDEKCKLSNVDRVRVYKKMDYTPVFKSFSHTSELRYWDDLHIGKPLLDFFNVRVCKQLRRVDSIIWEYQDDDPMYVYLTKDKSTFKIYKPLDKNKDRFRGVNNGKILEGWDQLPQTGDHLFINSSFKDTMCMRRLGYLGCNPTSENSYRTLFSYAREINLRFKKVYVFLDNDLAGILAARFIKRNTNWEVTMIERGRIFDPISGKMAKDQSDTIKYTGNYLYISDLLSNFELTKYHI